VIIKNPVFFINLVFVFVFAPDFFVQICYLHDFIGASTTIGSSGNIQTVFRFSLKPDSFHAYLPSQKQILID